MVNGRIYGCQWNHGRQLRSRIAITIFGASLIAPHSSFANEIYPTDGARLYSPEYATQMQWNRLEDLVPPDVEVRKIWARNLAFDVYIYGLPTVEIYRQMYDQAIKETDPAHVGFNRFAHGRKLAGPDYAPFKSPNADTLYSNAYLDLRDGPILFDVPDTAGRYYTANFLDMFGNATNISARTHGTKGGRYLIATGEWQGAVPDGVEIFRVASPFMWILLRVLVKDQKDAAIAARLQDQFVLQSPKEGDGKPAFPDGTDNTPAGFLRILDFMMRENGHPVREQGLVRRFRSIGVAGPKNVDEVMMDDATREGIEQGFLEAEQVVKATIVANSRRGGSWSNPVDVGRYGYNYLYRSVVNTLGTGGNVVLENYPFTSFDDADGARLDGSKGLYELRLSPPPPAKFFWSVTVYDARTRSLHPNVLGKYLVSDRTPGLVRDNDGNVTIYLHARPLKDKEQANWLPVPAGPFYVAIRAQGPGQALLDREWSPPAIIRTGSAQ